MAALCDADRAALLGDRGHRVAVTLGPGRPRQTTLLSVVRVLARHRISFRSSSRSRTARRSAASRVGELIGLCTGENESMSSSQGPARSRKPSALIKATNPLTARLAGRRWFPAWAQLRHCGRRSGKEYVIPVAVLVTPGSFVISLPWGPQTNWVRNVLAAGECTIRWKGTDHHVTDPQLVDAAVAVKAANRIQRAVITRASFPAFLQLQR
jgi:deazaflavin-dependent oxidoreductase (nitroreductase family)